MNETILIPEPVAPEAVQYLEEKGYKVRHGRGADKRLLCEDMRGCAGALVRTAVIDADVMDAGDCLRVLAKHGAGVDNIDIAAATARGIRVVNAPLGMTTAVAEYTLCCMLALCRNLIPCDAAFRKTGDFSLRRVIQMSELSGKTVLVVGMGRIGATVARMLLAFQARVLGYDPYLPDDRLPSGVTRAGDLDAALSQADIVTLHVPLSAETRHILDAERIARMKPGALLVNAGRGALTDEKALIAALQSGRIAGASIDVFEQEPPAADHPFFSMPNVIVSPHNSALTPQAIVRMAVDAAQGIDEVLTGRAVTWRVNF